MTTIMQLSFGIVVVDDENDEDDNGYSKREVTKKEEGLGGTKGANVTNETMTTPENGAARTEDRRGYFRDGAARTEDRHLHLKPRLHTRTRRCIASIIMIIK
jgi:hypothetical protein